jgi:hypothetical protein
MHHAGGELRILFVPCSPGDGVSCASDVLNSACIAASGQVGKEPTGLVQ